MRFLPICLVLAIAATVPAIAPAGDSQLATVPRPATAAYDPDAPYRAVHVDTLDPSLQHVFEQTRRAWLKVLSDHHTSDGRGYFLQRDGHTLITLHSFGSFTEYDALRTFRAGVAGRIGPDGEQAGQRYDAGDVAITAPHNSEVWSRNQELDYRGPGRPLSEYDAGYMRMLAEQVHTDDYAAAWTQIRAALKEANYPLDRISFFSMIGSGRTISFWLARDRKAFDEAGTPQAAVARVLGAERADALFARLTAACIDVQVSEVVPRPELKSPE